MTTVKMPDGTICYSGPTCRKHGAFYSSSQKNFLKKVEATNLSKIEHILSELAPSKEKMVYGINSDPENKTSELKELDVEADYFRKNYGHDLTSTVDYYSNNFEYMNMFLRNGRKGIIEYLNRSFGDLYDQDYIQRIEVPLYLELAVERVKSLDKVFAAYERPTSKFRRLYRTIEISKNTKLPEIGEVYKDKSYMSTSIDPDITLVFNGTDHTKENIVFEIISKNGVPIHQNGRSTTSVSHAEREVLLNRNSRFVVTGKKKVTFVNSYPDGRPRGSHYKTLKIPRKKVMTVIQMVEIEGN